ncbi:MAG: hypothetical protein KAY37_03555 [Phycisphaerae bacterium]|nr:hypothetical protein [Phycisphaerae bacterium]
MRWDAYVVACALAVTASSTAWASSVHAVVATEGRLAVYTGSADGAELELVGANQNTSTSLKNLSPQEYLFEVEDQRYIYLMVWSNPGTAGGVLAEILFNGLPVLSGDPAWEVYTTPLRLAGDAAAPGTSVVGQQIRTANRRFAWEKAAVDGVNGVGPAGLVAGLSADAAWMWRPGEPVDLTVVVATPRAAECLIFRISPTELWPEIELWHGRNVGTGPLTGGTFNGNADYRFLGDGGGGGRGGYGLPWGGPGAIRGIGNPFEDFRPPGSTSIPPTITTEEEFDPLLPPVPDELPYDSTSTSVERSIPDEPPDEPPVIPEPGTALLMLPGFAWFIRRR